MAGIGRSLASAACSGIEALISPMRYHCIRRVCNIALVHSAEGSSADLDGPCFEVSSRRPTLQGPNWLSTSSLIK